ncbi:MAG TPA: FxsA family protein [Acidimicrobiales bacterium]|jgi:UPF0716 protein FxsA
MGLLVLVFLVVPIVELAVVVRVADSIGLGDTILLLIGISLVGAWLVKREGIGAWNRAQAAAAQGRIPDRELVDGVMILVGGAFLLTPGFVTDGVGLALLLPPVRAGLRAFAARRITARARFVSGPGMGGGGWVVDDITVVSDERVDDPPPRGGSPSDGRPDELGGGAE